MFNIFSKSTVLKTVPLVIVIAISCLAAPATADEALVILPSQFTLTGSEARQTLLVEAVIDGHHAGQLTENVTLISSNSQVVRIENGVALPVSDGKAIITATAGKRKATTAVTVERQQDPHHWNFRIHVESVLSKTGCNSGACHGALAGKNGFKLSLRGYDPDYDFQAITRQAQGRRVVPGDPGRSLFLTKPSGAVPHKGGLRFDVDSEEYRVLSQWIATGQAPPQTDDPKLERLEILPANVVLRADATQQLVVRAHFNDGHSKDVTRWVKFTSTNETVAQVDETGSVSVMGHGEGNIVGWYLGSNTVSTVTVPFESRVAADVFTAAERRNLIDNHVLDKLQSLNIPPSRQCADEVFIRRAFLDTIGMLPDAEETRKFLADKSPDKRNRLVDGLLARPEFVDYWAYKWSDLLLVTGARLRPKAVESYYGWIRKQVAENAAWDDFARGVLLAKGSTIDNGAANFYSLHQDPQDMAETVSMAFLGMSIGCARCHDHPLEKWTNNDYYSMANLFSRVRGKGWGGDFRSGDGNRVIFVAAEGELIQPRTGKPQPPKPLDGEAVPFDESTDRRGHLAGWLTSPENPYFGRAIVNRVWANFFGVGIVERVDDLRLTNPPSNEPLMAGLADFLAKNKYDLKKLMRLILTSATYQRSSEALPGNESDQRYYSRYYPRRMQAEVLLDALSQATDKPTKFKDKPDGTRALQLPDASVDSYFLKTFGRPERIITCECERSAEPSMVQVLHIMNGGTLNNKLAAADNRLGKLLAAKTPSDKLVDEAYLTALSRYPTAVEKKSIVAVLADADAKDSQLATRLEQTFRETLSREPTAEERKRLLGAAAGVEKRQAVEDLFWSILSSKEFLFHR